MEDTNKVSSEWKEVLLKDISLGKGEYGIGASAVEYSDELPTYLRITDINDDGTLNYTGFKSVDDKNSYKYKLKRNDVVFARTGNSTGKGYFYEEDDGEFIYAGFLIKFSLDESKINPNYIGLYIQSKEYKNWINSIVTGSTRKNINAKMYGEMPIKLPSRNVQDRVVEIGKSINNKIKINNQMNQTLEEMAQAIFKEWFVEFNFPITPNFGSSPLDKGEGGKILGYKDNGGEMEESELGEIPEGWRVEELGKAFDVTMGQSPKGSSYNENRKGSVFYQGRTDFNFRFPSNRIFTTEPKRMAKQLDVLLSVRAPVGDVNVATEECCIGRGIAAITSTKTSFLLYTMKNLSQKFKMFDNEGTVFGSINKKGLEELKIIVPSDEILNLFEGTVSSIDGFIFNNSKEIETLINIRDTLLPKLMSGEVRV